MRLFGMLLAAVLCVPSFARSEDSAAVASPTYKACMAQAGGVTTSMRACISEESKKQDQRLNTVYKQLTKSMDDTTRPELVKAQRLWIPYRDANCQLQAAGETGGGTLGPVIIDSCVLDMTTSRADELEKLSKRSAGL